MSGGNFFGSPGSFTGGYPYSQGAQGSEKFPNPFFDISSTFMPTELHTMLELCEYIYLNFGTWRMASRRVIRYFLTEIIVEGDGDDEREEFEDVLKNDIHLMTELANIGDDFMCYGNVFVSVIMPFERFLRSPAGIEYRASKVEYTYDVKKNEFRGYCKKAKKTVTFEVQERRSVDKSRVKIKRWNPKEIQLRVHPVTGETEYYWEIPERFCERIKEGQRFYVENTPREILDCISANKGGKRPLFKFSYDSIRHVKESTLAGVPVVGWGIPPIMANFKLAYYIQVLRRFDEAIALDYIVPFRVIYPDYGPSAAQDPLKTQSMSVFRGIMQNMVQEHRKDPTRVQVAPFKVGYQMLGGEGASLSPREQIGQALDELLNALGYPAELYKGTLSIQAFPVALRLFERTWGALVDDYNDLIGWILTSISQYFDMGEFTGKLRSVTLADDLERKALSLQAAAGMDISKSTAYMPFGIDYMEEQRRVVEEQQSIQSLQQEAMNEQQAQQSLGGEGGGGEGGPGGAPGGATPGDVHEQAKSLAQTLLIQTPETQRRGELIKIKHSNPTLHALVIQEMDNMRQEMSSQGKTMMMEQAKQDMQGAGGGMVATASADRDGVKTAEEAAWVVLNEVYGYTRDDLKKLASQVRSLDMSDPARRGFHYVYRTMKGWPITNR